MKYIVCEKPGSFLLKEKDAPKRGENEALLRVKKVGICGTDLHAYAGNQAFFTYPRILGHELACEVLEIDSNEQNIQVGDRVSIMPYKSCNNCISCNSGKTNCCTKMQVFGVHIDGGMQEIISVPTSLLLKTPGLSYDQMAIIEPLAIGAHAIRRAALQAGEYAVVMGCGPIGVGIMKQAQLKGAKIIALDVNQDRLDYVKKEIGIEYTVIASENTPEDIKAITGGDLATVVFDASGNKRALESGPNYMAHGGRFVLVGLFNGDLNFNHPAIHAKETTLMCSRNATTEDFESVIAMIDQFPTESFITHSVPFTEMIENFDRWLDPKTGVIKASIEF